jgi:capsular polysaccharide biosynthesis protein
MVEMVFENNDIQKIHFDKNSCYRVRDLIVDTREDRATFWVNGKRLVKFLNRDNQYRLITEEFSMDQLKPVDEIIPIDDSLFIMWDDLSKTAGHFFIDCFPRLWYYEKLGGPRYLKLGLVFAKDKQYNPRQLLDLKYFDNVVELDRNKVYRVRDAVIPGTFVWWDDRFLSKRFVDFVEDYFSMVKTPPDSFDRFYLSRQDVSNLGERRQLVNELDLINALSEQGVASKSLMPLTANEFISCFRNKRHVIGCEGSGWSYGALVSPNTCLTTIVHPRVNIFFNWLFELAKYKNIKLRFIYPKIEFYGKSDNSAWKILNLAEVVDQIMAPMS